MVSGSTQEALNVVKQRMRKLSSGTGVPEQMKLEDGS